MKIKDLCFCGALVLLALFLFLDHDMMLDQMTSLAKDLEYTRSQVQYLQEKLDHTEIIEVERTPNGFLVEVD